MDEWSRSSMRPSGCSMTSRSELGSICKSPSRQKSTISSLSLPLAILQNHSPSRQHHLRHSLHLPPLISAVINAHMVRRRADSLLTVRVEYDDIGVRPDSDRPFLGKQTEYLRCRRRSQFNKTIQ